MKLAELFVLIRAVDMRASLPGERADREQGVCVVFHAAHRIHACYNASGRMTSYGISVAYGQQGNRWYVNSGQRLSRDKVDVLFGRESKGDGSVALGYIETITSGADLKGNWAIRSYIEENLFPAGEESLLPAGQVRFAQRRAARRQAQRIMRDFAFPTTAEGLPYISKADLDARLGARKAAIHEGQLQRAAALKPSPWVWRLSGPDDSG